jgi:hypothetical protein
MCAAPAAPAPLYARACVASVLAPPLPALAPAFPALPRHPLPAREPPTASATHLAVAAVQATTVQSCAAPVAHVPLTASPPPYRSCAVLPRVLHVALLLPELRRGCHARRRRQLLLALITSSSGPRAPSLAPLDHVLAFAHFPSIQFPLTRSPLLTGPPPPSLLTVGSSHHCFPSSIRSAISTPMIHCSSPSDPIPFSFTRTVRL